MRDEAGQLQATQMSKARAAQRFVLVGCLLAELAEDQEQHAARAARAHMGVGNGLHWRWPART